MKIILTGSSGFIGQEVLRQALSNSAITSIVALSRKPLPPAFTKDPKLDVVLVKDFSSYSPEVLSKLEGAEACIWSIGAKSTSQDVTRKVSVEYPMAAAKAFSKVSEEHGKPFRFVYTSGVLAVRDPKKTVFLYGDARKVAGEVETELINFGNTHSPSFEAYILRPSAVLTKESTVMNYMMGFVPSVKVDELAMSMIDIAVNGSKLQTWENRDLAKRGKDLLSASALCK